MADLQQRYLNILKMPRQAVSSIGTFSPLSTNAGAGDSSIIGKVFKYGFYLGIVALIILLILLAVDYYNIYNKKPTRIFNFGDSPNALISFKPSTSDWQKYWLGSDTTSTITPNALPSYNYTMLFDSIILEDKDLTLNRPVMLFYRKSTQIPNNNFSDFLDFTKEIVTATSPDMYVTYNPHKSEIHIVFKLTKVTTQGTTVYNPKTLIVPIVAQQQYRIGVNISDKFVEVYKDGVWLQTLVFGNDGAPSGTNTDKFWYTPSTDINSARVRNLMLITPMVPSGIIRNMGTASINLDDLKTDSENVNICAK